MLITSSVCVCVCACSNGVGRTGVFIALHVILERMLGEGMVDVFQTVKNLRIQRPAMVQTLVCTNVGGPVDAWTSTRESGCYDVCGKCSVVVNVFVTCYMYYSESV